MKCLIEGCDREERARGLCKKHYIYHRNHGTLHEYPTKTVRHGMADTKEYQVWLNMNEFHDDVHFAWKASFQCFIDDMGIAPSGCTSITKINTAHGYSPDNCKWTSKTDKQYHSNTSGRRGVSWVKVWKKWKAYIYVGKENIILGHFDTKEEAIEAREKAEQKYWKEKPHNNVTK